MMIMMNIFRVPYEQMWMDFSDSLSAINSRSLIDILPWRNNGSLANREESNSLKLREKEFFLFLHEEQTYRNDKLLSKKKLQWTKLNSQGWPYSRLLHDGGETRMEYELNSTETKGRRASKGWNGLVEDVSGRLIDVMCRAHWVISWVPKCFSVIRPSNEAPAFPQRLGGKGAISLDDYILKQWLPGPRERHPWTVKLARLFKKNLHISQSGRERIYNYKFSRQNARGKGRSGPRVGNKLV